LRLACDCWPRNTHLLTPPPIPPQSQPQGVEGSKWAHKTWYYSDQPSLQQLRELEAAHAARIAAVLRLEQQGGARPQPRAAEPNSSSSRGRGSSAAGLVTLKLSDNLLDGNTGCHEWEAGFVLAEFVFNHPAIFADRRCLDVGCGSGLVGLALHRVAAAAPVVLLDGDAAALANCERNMALNGVRAVVVDGFAAAADAPVACCHAQWEEAAPPREDDDDGLGQQFVRLPVFDVIVASDVLYDPAIVGPFVRLLAKLLRAAGGAAVAYIATTLRNPKTLQLFENTAAGRALALERLSAAELGGGAGAAPVAFQQAHALRTHRRKSVEGGATILLHRVTLAAS